MSDKSPRQAMTKKSSKSIREKRADKQARSAVNEAAKKNTENTK